MNLSHLHYFITLADEGHFARAAKQLSIARSTLSLAISQLENELGAPMFVKNGSNFQLTSYGEEFYRYASLALHNLETGSSKVRTMIEDKEEVLRLGVLSAMQDKNWARVLRSFRSSSDAAFRVDIKQDFSGELLHQLAIGELDLTFATKLDDAPDGLVYLPYWSQELVVAVNKLHPLATRASISFNDLRSSTIYSYAPGCPPHDRIQQYADAYDLNLQTSFKDEITICSVVSADPEAVAFVDYSFLTKVFSDVVCIPLEGVPVNFHEIYLVYRDNEPMSRTRKLHRIRQAPSHPASAFALVAARPFAACADSGIKASQSKDIPLHLTCNALRSEGGCSIRKAVT